MIGAACLVLGIVVSTIQWGWQDMPEGGHEYVVQVEPQLTDIDAFRKSGFVSDIPPGLRDIRRIRIVVGSDPLQHQGEMPTETAPLPTDPAARTVPKNVPPIAAAPIIAAPITAGPIIVPPETAPPGTLPTGVSAEPLKAARPLDAIANKIALADGHQPADGAANSSESPVENTAPTPARSKPRSPSDKPISEESTAASSATGSATPARPWLTLLAVAGGLIVSLSGNVFLGWVHWETRNQYRSLVTQLRAQRSAARRRLQPDSGTGGFHVRKNLSPSNDPSFLKCPRNDEPIADMSKARILLQLDTDPQPSVFDAVVAIDAGAEHLLRHGNVTVEGVRELIYGGMFTRGPADLHSTAVFIGGSNVAAAEKIFDVVRRTFFEPLRMSVLMDAGGSNTTAAAAVLSAAKHLDLSQTTALVLGGTGSVGHRVARLLAGAGATVRVGSRDLKRAEAICDRLAERVGKDRLSAWATSSDESLRSALDGAALLVAAGPPGAVLLDADVRRSANGLKLAIDLNAVPPLGIEGISPTDAAKNQDGTIVYGGLGVGGLKMKIHKAAIRRLFESNDAILDAEEIFALGRRLFDAI